MKTAEDFMKAFNTASASVINTMIEDVSLIKKIVEIDNTVEAEDIDKYVFPVFDNTDIGMIIMLLRYVNASYLLLPVDKRKEIPAYNFYADILECISSTDGMFPNLKDMSVLFKSLARRAGFGLLKLVKDDEDGSAK